MTLHWLFLGIAITAEVIATSSLKASEGFTKPLPTTVVIAGYATAAYFLSRTLDVIPVGIAYAIWSALGIVLVSLISWIMYRQHLDLPALLGLALIIAGVMVVNLWSKSIAH
jgi:small multidrug resistance pump